MLEITRDLFDIAYAFIGISMGVYYVMYKNEKRGFWHGLIMFLICFHIWPAMLMYNVKLEERE